ncbi:MAG TPA: CPXCG motif-containing cysteine-rich protein [Gemmatimonadaceae bacterium]|nr:CPXCG motif-containing cysteine-rich protein [Gemmatimonadaceae bacterium]
MMHDDGRDRGNGSRRDSRDDFLDDEFPLGDGTADTEALVLCPYCGAATEIALDPGSGATQDYVEDCEVCCRPWRVSVRYLPDGSASVHVEPEDGE